MQGVPIDIDDLIHARSVEDRYCYIWVDMIGEGKVKAWFGLGIATGISAVIGLLL